MLEASSTGTAGPRPTSAFLVRRVRGADDLTPFLPAWESLASEALDPNPFYEPWMLPAALEALGLRAGLEFVFVFKDGPPGSQPQLCGFFPLERLQRFHRMPVPVLRLCDHMYCSLGTPLVHAECAGPALEAFLDWLASPEADCALLEFQKLPVDGPFYSVLTGALSRRNLTSLVDSQYTRALYRETEDPSIYLAHALAGKRRKHLRRNRELLAELGSLEFSALDSGADVRGWISEFLELEVSGWKGVEGTALACSPAHRRFFETVALEAFRRNRLAMSALRLDGRMIAARTLFSAGAGRFIFKIAYAESYARFSPGMLLESEAILARQPGAAAWTDSCTAPGDNLYKHLWRDRRTLQHLLIAPGKRSGRWAVALFPLLRQLNRKIRGCRQAPEPGESEQLAPDG